MTTLTTELTAIEFRALESVAVDPQEWSTNAVKNRARVATVNICASLLKHCNENAIAMAVGVDAQVTQAYDLGIVTTAAESNAAREQSAASG
jgi:hypothetical protein|tara:strand:+ start:192 stop:467 length:276 start_codon:yes stop_codon:yes gene_type:complete